MTKTDFAELKEKLLDESSNLLMASIIISELIEIIQSQSEALELIASSYSQIGDAMSYPELAKDYSDRTTTRLQKLREGKV